MKINKFLVKVSLVALAVVGFSKIGALPQLQVSADNVYSMEDARAILKSQFYDNTESLSSFGLGHCVVCEKNDRAFATALSKLWSRKSYGGISDPSNKGDLSDEEFSKKLEEGKKQFKQDTGFEYDPIGSSVGNYSTDQLERLGRETGETIVSKTLNFSDDDVRRGISIIANGAVIGVPNENKSSEDALAIAAEIERKYAEDTRKRNLALLAAAKERKAAKERAAKERAAKSEEMTGTSLLSSVVGNEPQQSSSKADFGAFSSFSEKPSASQQEELNKMYTEQFENHSQAYWDDYYRSPKNEEASGSSYSYSPYLSASYNQQSLTEMLNGLDDAFAENLRFIYENNILYGSSSHIRDVVAEVAENLNKMLKDKVGTPDWDRYKRAYEFVVGRYYNDKKLNSSDVFAATDEGKKLVGSINNIKELIKNQNNQSNAFDEEGYYFGSQSGVDYNDLKSSDFENSNLNEVVAVKDKTVAANNKVKFNNVVSSNPVSVVKSNGVKVESKVNANASQQAGFAVNVNAVANAHGVDKAALEEYINSDEEKFNVKDLKDDLKKIKNNNINKKGKKLSAKGLAKVRRMSVIKFLKDLVFDAYSNIDAVLFGRGNSQFDSFYANLFALENAYSTEDIKDCVENLNGSIINYFNNHMDVDADEQKGRLIAKNFVDYCGKAVENLSVVAEDLINDKEGLGKSSGSKAYSYYKNQLVLFRNNVNLILGY